MTTGADESGQGSGKEFREKFEATQAENAQLRGLVAEQYGVSAEDLKGVPADQIGTKAQELKQAQEAQEKAVLRKHLGLGEDDDLEAALAKLKGDSGQRSGSAGGGTTPRPFAPTGALEGTPVTDQKQPPEGVRGADRLRWVFSQGKQ